MGFNEGGKLDPEKYEPNTVREKESICPFIGKECVKDSKLCGRWQPFHIVEMKLNVPQVKLVHMCVDDSLRIATETILNLLQTMVHPGNMPRGMSGGPGRGSFFGG